MNFWAKIEDFLQCAYILTPNFHCFLQASLELINHSLDNSTLNDNSYEIHRPRSVAAEQSNSDVVIVPKRGPRPPARRRPKSTPIRYENQEKVSKSRKLVLIHYSRASLSTKGDRDYPGSFFANHRHCRTPPLPRKWGPY